MSAQVDQRVVEMRFDNKQFEKNVSTTMSTLDKLKAKLNFKGAKDGLEDIDKAAKKIDLKGLGDGVQEVTVKFSALRTIAETALSRIVNTALDAGIKVAKAFTLDPVKTGFQEYETQIGAIQTILANTQSKGSTLTDVTAALNELNHYADLTIYNFTEMTRNIGTFTAAGVGLEESVAAIKGIANLAAVSGSTSQQASTAMYQLSQALASGTVKLQDWNSVVNAGMGGEVFQNALKRTAKQMGKNVDAIIEKAGSFRESLSKGWLTKDVLTETLAQISGAYTEADLLSQGYSESQAKEISNLAKTAVDAATKVKTFTQLIDTTKEAAQSGWTQSWQLMIGDFNDAKNFFTQLSDILGTFIGESADARNAILRDAMNSRWDNLLEGMNAAGVDMEKFGEHVAKTSERYGMSSEKLNGLIEKYGGLSEVIRNGAIPIEMYTSSWKSLQESIEQETAAAEESYRTALNARIAFEEKGAATEQQRKQLEELIETEKKEQTAYEALLDRNTKMFDSMDDMIHMLSKSNRDIATTASRFNLTWTEFYRVTREAFSNDNAIDYFNSLTQAEIENLGYTKDQAAALKTLASQAKRTGKSIAELRGEMSGRQALQMSAVNAIQAVIKLLTTIKGAWAEIFPSERLSASLNRLSKNILTFTEHLILTDDAADKLKRTFKGVFAILDIVSTVFGTGIKLGFKTLSKLLGMTNIDILDMTANLGDMIVSFRDWLFENNMVVKGFAKLGGYLKAGAKLIKQWAIAFVQLPAVQSALQRLQNGFADFAKKWNLHLNQTIQNFNAFIARVKAMDGLSIENIKSAFKDFWDNVLTPFFSMDEMFDNLGEKIKSFFTNFKQSLEKSENPIAKFILALVNLGGTVVKFITDFIKNITIGDIALLAFGVSMVIMTKKIANILDLLTGPIFAFNDVLDAAAKALNSFALKTKAEALNTVATAIVKIAAAIAMLAFIPAEKLAVAGGVIAGIAIALAALTFALSKMGEGGAGGLKSASVLVGLAIAIKLISSAFKEFNDITWGAIGKGLATVAIAVTALTAALHFMSGNNASVYADALVIAALGGAVWLIVDALQKVADKPLPSILKGMFALAAVMAEFVVAVGFIGKMGATNWQSTIVLIAAALAIRSFIGTLEALTKVNIGKIIGSLDRIIVVMGLFAVMLTSLRFAGKNAAKAGVGLVLMMVAMRMLVRTIKMVASMDQTNIETAKKIIAQLLLFMGAVVALSHFAGENAIKAGAMMLFLAGAMVILVGCVSLLSKAADIRPEAVAIATAAIDSMMAFLAVLIGVTGWAFKVEKKSSKVSMGPIIALVTGIAILAGTLAYLSNSANPAMLAGATIALDSIMGMFALLILATSKVKGANKGMIGILAVLAGLSALLLLISQMAPDDALKQCVALSALMLSLSAAMFIISNVNAPAVGAMGALLGVTLCMGMIIALLGYLSTIGAEVNMSIETAIALGVLMNALAASLLILSLVGNAAIPALAGVGVAIAAITAVIALIAGLGAIQTYVGDLQGLLDSGIPILVSVAEGIGQAIAAFVMGGIETAAAALPGIGMSIAIFSMALNTIPDGVGSKAGEVALAIAALSAGSFVEGLTSFLGIGGVDNLKTTLTSIGEGLKAFGESLDGADLSAIGEAATAGKSLGDMIETVNGLKSLSKSFGEGGNLSSFSENIGPLGTALKEFGMNVSGIGEYTSDITEAATAGTSLASLAKSLPSVGGTLQSFLGEHDMSAFGEGLTDFGEALMTFGESVSGIGTYKKAIEDATSLGDSLSELSNSLPAAGGTLQTFFGEHDLGAFGNSLKDFGTSLMGYGETVNGIAAYKSAIEESAGVTQSIVNVVNTLPTTGAIQDFFGGKDFGAFSTNLTSLGEALSGFATASQGIGQNSDSVSKAVTVTSSLVSIINRLPESHIFDGKMDLDDFGKQMEKLGKSLTKFMEGAENFSPDSLTTIVDGLTGISNLLVTISGTDVSGIGTFKIAIEDLASTNFSSLTSSLQGAEGIVEAGASLITALSESLTSAGSILETTGSDVMGMFISGMQAKASAAGVAAKSVANTAKNAARTLYWDFYSCGSYLGQGIVAGLRSQSSSAYSAGYDVARSAVKGANAGAATHSPSKETMWTGEMMVDGLAIALGKTQKVYRAGEALGTAAVDAINDSVKSIDSGISNDIYDPMYDEMIGLVNAIEKDFTPEIEAVINLSPVIDTEAVREQLRQIGSESFNANVSAIRNGFHERDSHLNGDNSKKGTQIINNYGYTQNNYSPKALSRSEIYRQTKNQISAMKQANTMK